MQLLIPITLLVASVAAEDIQWHHIRPRHINDHSIELFIIDGQDAKPKEFPYQVALSLQKNFMQYFCGGTLISNLWIVTAAHCTQGVSSIDVSLGTTNRMAKTEPGRKTIKVPKKNIIVHEKWNKTTASNDISLLKLPAPVKFNDYIKPAKLPKLGTFLKYAGEKVKATGWGITSDTGDLSPILQWIEVIVMDNKDCERESKRTINDTQVCTKDKKSPCHGDSGGPIVLADGSNTIIGITSFATGYSCELGYPIVFTRITSYLDWIKAKTGVGTKK